MNPNCNSNPNPNPNPNPSLTRNPTPNPTQHEQHLRAVLGLPLGGTALKVPAVGMLNVIGSADGELATTLRPVARAMAMPRASVHWCATVRARVRVGA